MYKLCLRFFLFKWPIFKLSVVLMKFLFIKMCTGLNFTIDILFIKHQPLYIPLLPVIDRVFVHSVCVLCRIKRLWKIIEERKLMIASNTLTGGNFDYISCHISTHGGIKPYRYLFQSFYSGQK